MPGAHCLARYMRATDRVYGLWAFLFVRLTKNAKTGVSQAQQTAHFSFFFLCPVLLYLHTPDHISIALDVSLIGNLDTLDCDTQK